MKKAILSLLACIGVCLVQAQTVTTPADSSVYYSSSHYLIEGTGIPGSEKESPFDRLPLSSKGKVRKAVWDLSKNSAGISLRFLSNSSSIKVKWGVLNDTRFNHMAPTGIKGVDLYCKVDGKWIYVNTGKPTGRENQALLVSGLSSEEREYRIFLPLYDGTTHLEVGIEKNAWMRKAQPGKTLPIIFYGTSILQGGCASRPGMAFTNIISRKLDADCYNFGFSGNGRMDPPIADVIARLEASYYVIDCLPNMTAAQVTDSVIPLARAIRERNPSTPIVFVEGLEYARTLFETDMKKNIDEKNEALRTEFDKLVKQGFKDIHYIDSRNAIGNDNEGTVDGSHMTDLGFMRYSEFLLAKFDELGLKIKNKQ